MSVLMQTYWVAAMRSRSSLHRKDNSAHKKNYSELWQKRQNYTANQIRVRSALIFFGAEQPKKKTISKSYTATSIQRTMRRYLWSGNKKNSLLLETNMHCTA